MFSGVRDQDWNHRMACTSTQCHTPWRDFLREPHHSGVPHCRSLLQATDSESPIEALLLDRDRLIRVLRNALYELHDERRRQEGTAGHAEVVQRIRYFDAILG